MTYPYHWFSEQVGLAGCANFEDSIKDVVTETMTEPTLREHMEEVQADYGSYTTTPRFNKNVKFELDGGDDEVLMDDIVSSDDKREESGNKNHSNNNANSIFKPYLDAQEENNICTIMKGHDEHRLETRDCNVDKLDDIWVRNNALHLFNEDGEALNKGVCKSETFEVIRYLLGHSEEYVAISTCKYDVWKRTEGIVSCVYHDIFTRMIKGGS
ncbi:hypothetical protein Tco_0620082 [Tanacetum coccineum]